MADSSWPHRIRDGIFVLWDMVDVSDSVVLKVMHACRVPTVSVLRATKIYIPYDSSLSNNTIFSFALFLCRSAQHPLRRAPHTAGTVLCNGPNVNYEVPFDIVHFDCIEKCRISFMDSQPRIMC